MNFKPNLIKFHNSNNTLKPVQEKPKMNSDDKQIEFLTSKLFEALFERVEKEVPENGKFAKIGVSFDIPNSMNTAKVIVEHDAIEPKNSRRLSIGVSRQNSDRITSSYILKASKKEILDYIKDSNNQPEIIKNIKELSKSVDDYYFKNF